MIVVMIMTIMMARIELGTVAEIEMISMIIIVVIKSTVVVAAVIQRN